MSTPPQSTPIEPFEVKGIWFVSARDFIAQHEGPAALEAFSRAMPEPHREVLLEALHSAWYPEDALAALLDTIHETVSAGDPDATVRIIREIAMFGVGRFFKLLLSLSSARFAVRQVPTLWARMRRGPAHVFVENTSDGAMFRVRAFPYVSRRPYQLMTRGTLEAICHATGATHCRAHLVGSGPDWADFHVTL